MTDWERAGAVIERLRQRSSGGDLVLWRDVDRCAAGWYDEPESYIVLEGFGPTDVAALLDLGAKLDKDAPGTRQNAPGRAKAWL